MNDTTEVDRALRTARSFAEEAIAANIQWRLDPRYIKTLCDEIDRLRAAAPANANEPVKVKPLEWLSTTDGEHMNGHTNRRMMAKASMPFGTYHIELGPTGWYCLSNGLTGAFAGPLATESEAKAATQSHFDQRIRSALYTGPEVTP